jgi:hypothetical protein
MTSTTVIAFTSIGFSLLATTISASAQTAAPTGGPGGRGAQGKVAIPDFSGIWAHLTFPDVEPPVSGAGPVRNLSRVTVEVARTLAPYNGAPADVSPNGVSNISELVGDFTNPILKPEAAEVVKRHGELAQKKLPYPTPSNQCWPGGVPFVFWNIGMQMLQQKDKVTILYANDYAVRHVYMNRTHPEHVTPSWYGDSVGHYEGDTLVIDTVGIKVGPFAMVDQFGTPHSEALHVVERYRLLDYESANESEDRGERENFRIQFSDTVSRATRIRPARVYGREPGRVHNPLVSPPGSVLALAPDGSLWASTEFGLAWRDKDRHWQTYTRASTKGRSGRDFPKAALTPPPNSRSLCASVEA